MARKNDDVNPQGGNGEELSVTGAEQIIPNDHGGTPHDPNDHGGTLHDDGPIEGASDPRLGITYLTIARMGCNPEMVKLDKEMRLKLALPPEGPITFARVYGELTGISETKFLSDKQTGETRESWGLVGLIEGVNLITGEFYQSGAWYAPSGFNEMYLAEVRAQIEATRGNARVRFAHEYEAFVAENPRGYSWRMRNLMPMQRHDPLASLRRRALSGSTLQTRLLTHGEGPMHA